ncbi:MAG: tRNA (adenosine(37)-N6)-threonylcarbamoyltransferase complex ATPase subunit type 1 TsaE [Bdellovibrionota bacterium]
MLQKFLATEADTVAFGVSLAPNFRPGDIVKITGELGAGKTTLVRGIVQGLGGNPADVHSPTFGLVHVYQTPQGPVNHCDFYRLPNNSELEDFGGLEFFESDTIFLIEWPERVKLFESAIPNRLLGVDLRGNATGREVRLNGPWQIVD